MIDEEDEEPAEQHNIFRANADGDMRVHVLREMCPTCIFNPKTRPVAGSRVAGMVSETMDEDGATVVCHHTLYDTPEGEQKNAVCRGWYDRLGDRDNIIRLARAMDIIEEQEGSTHV